jgi:hypothetical protein
MNDCYVERSRDISRTLSRNKTIEKFLDFARNDKTREVEKLISTKSIDATNHGLQHFSAKVSVQNVPKRSAWIA